MTKNTTILMIATIASFVMFAPLNEAFASGELYVATDNEEFTGPTPPDRIAKMITNGPLVISTQIIVTDYPVNGLGDGGDFMFAGTPSEATLRTIDWDGNLLTTVPAGWSSGCCSEDMAFDPVPQIGSPNGILYHAHHADNIQAVDPIDPTIVFQTFPQSDVVGMAYVDGTIWISKWANTDVGTWNPATNIFTKVFDTPAFAGMLAYDPEDEILWVGMRGGQIIPYDLLGNQLGPAHLPFGALPNTIDGGVFRGESIQRQVEKIITHTNNDWNRVCTLFEEVEQPDGSFVTECTADRLANIHLDDVFADPLPNPNGPYELLGDEKRKKTVVNPGQYIQATSITVLVDQDVWMTEDVSSCSVIGSINPNKVPGGVQVVRIDGTNGDVIDIDDDLAAGIGGSLTLTGTIVDVHVDDVPAGDTIRVMVKFQPSNELGIVGQECTLTSEVLDVDDNVVDSVEADLVIVQK